MRSAQHGRACAEPPSLLLQPHTNHRYVIRHLIGKGGFARVYSVLRVPPDYTHTTPRLDSANLHARHDGKRAYQPFALKVISKSRLGDTAKGREALRNEVSIHRHISHPGIVKLEAFWEDADRIYLLMELVEGPQLETLVATRVRLTEKEAAVYTMSLLEAVSYLHANRIVHRDIKLANIMLTAGRDRTLLCDFGLAAHLDSLKETNASNVCGTPNYVAPELIAPSILGRGTKGKLAKGRGKNAYTTGADMWSVGIALYTMLVGCGPFDSEDVPRTFRRIRTARFTFPPGMGLSADVKHLIRLLLSEDLNRRPSADQALKHPFFLAGEAPKRMPCSSDRVLGCENGEEHESPSLNDGRKGIVPVGDVGIREDRPDASRRTDNNGLRSRRLGMVNRRGADMKRWSGSYQRGLGVRRNGEGSGRVVSDLNRGSIGLRQERGSLAGTERRAGHISTRTSHRAVRERSSSMSTSEAMNGFGSRRGTDRSRRSSLNTRMLESIRESRWVGMTNTRKRDSFMMSDARNRLLNLSVTLSAALVKGRKYLDETQGEGGRAMRRSRYESVTRVLEDAEGGPPLVKRWLDYTSKYGFATMMNDGRSGCCFNDGTIMVYLSETNGIPNFAYMDNREDPIETDSEGNDNQAAKSKDISKKACLCTLFADMMDEGGRGTMYDLPSACNVSFLKPESDDHEQQVIQTTSREESKDVVHVREWLRLRKFRVAAFRLSNQSIHVKFDVGGDRCDDYVFDVNRGELFYTAGKENRGLLCDVRALAEFSGVGEQLWTQLELCSLAISKFLE